MNFYIFKFIIFLIICSFSNCLFYSLGWTGRGIDSLFEQKYEESCNDFNIRLIPKYPFQEIGSTTGFIGDTAFAITTGGAQGISYLILLIVGFGLTSHPPRPIEKPLEGWTGNYQSECRTNVDFFYKSYILPLESSEFRKIGYDDDFLICQSKLQNIANKSILKDMFTTTLEREIDKKEYESLRNKISNYNDISIKTASCRIVFNDNVNFVDTSEKIIHNCNCIFYFKINGGKNFIIDLVK